MCCKVQFWLLTLDCCNVVRPVTILDLLCTNVVLLRQMSGYDIEGMCISLEGYCTVPIHKSAL